MEAFFVVCVIAAVAWFFVSRSRNQNAGDQLPPLGRSRNSPSSRSESGKSRDDKAPQVIAGKPALTIAGNGSFSFPVVGESNYQAALRRIAGVESAKGKRHECDAVIVHQQNNRHDKNACAVTIEDDLVGYLPREEAKTVVSIMRSKGLEEGFSVGCRAIIKGGWVAADGYKGNYGVDLDIDTGEFPATAIQKEMVRFLGQKTPKGISQGQAMALREKAAHESDSRYSQWVALEEIIEYLHSEDGRDEFSEIKKPTMKAIREAFEHQLKEGKSPEQIADEIDEMVDLMIDQNPALEK